MQDLGEICEFLSRSRTISDEYLQQVKYILNQRQYGASSWIDPFETTSLQQTHSLRQLEIIKRLLLHEKIRRGQMENDTHCQSLALDVAAADGNLKDVVDLCTNNPRLVLDKENSDSYGLAIPVLRGSNAGHREVALYLYEKTSRNVLMDRTDGYYSATCLLLDAVFYGFLDIALAIVDELPSLAVTKHALQRSTPLRFLALKPDLFPSHCELGFWRRLVYSCIDLESDQPNQNTRLISRAVQCLPKWFGVKHIYELKDKHCKAQKLLQKACAETAEMDKDEMWKDTVYGALFEAVEYGNKEFFIEIIKYNPELLFISEPTSGQNLFQLAVRFKKDKIFNLIHGLDDINATLLRKSHDNENNNILHLAAQLSPTDHLSKVSGSALKMQRRIQWVEEVKSLVSEREVVQKNKDKKTPRQVFEESHEPLRREGEKWMKYTATACSFVAVLIATVTFQAIFTAPGGYDGDSGKPLLRHDLHFTAFLIADALAFFASCISVLIFLSILTARYSFDDFILSLPRKMILGLTILFFSIASMLIAFTTAFSSTMSIRRLQPLKPLGTLPVILFLILLYPLLKEMISSTYGKGIFHRNTKKWL